jgi:hypothetical protein
VSANDLGPIYTKGKSYRARAEARQRGYRASLGIAHGRYGHFLAPEAAAAGRNFVTAEAFEAAQARERAGKGVAPRTFENMLSSQAMAFNLFAPLSTRLELAAETLKPFIPGLAAITSIEIEHTPAADIFRDQTGHGGVDCDLFIEGTTTNGEPLVLVVESKFVEPEFSICGFRKSGRAEKGQAVCSEQVAVRADRGACLYTRNKGYKYWQRSDEHELLVDGAVADAGCPFAGARWQLWVNLALAHEEAKRRGAKDVRFAVCTSANNEALLDAGKVLDGFRALLRRPEAIHLIDVDALLAHLETIAPPNLACWTGSLSARYRGI